MDEIRHAGASRPCCVTACWRRPARQEIVDKLGVELRKLADDKDVQQRIHAEGGDPLTSTPAEYAADIVSEEAKWGGLVRKLGLKVE